MTLQDFFNDNRDNRDNLCDNVFVSMRSLCFYAKPLFLCEACCLYCLYCRFNHLSCHANIVQRVKSCYKIKINYRESKSCFCVVLLQC